MKTILEICQEVADLAAVKRPDDLFNANSQQESIFLSIAKSALDSMLRYGDWQELTKEGSIFTIKGKKRYIINELVPDFYAILSNTIYIKDSSEKVIGAITPEQWMREKCFMSNSCNIKFKIQNGCIVFLHEPPANVRVVFQYRSNNIVWDYDTYEEKNKLTANTDVPIFDEYLVKLNILWRWLKRSGMDYTEEYNEYAFEMKKRYGSGLATGNICLAKSVNDLTDDGGINVIAYNKSDQ